MILILISLYRIADIVMGVMANIFYLEKGYKISEINATRIQITLQGSNNDLDYFDIEMNTHTKNLVLEKMSQTV